jgi:sulfite reductase (ferredoxin)
MEALLSTHQTAALGRSLPKRAARNSVIVNVATPSKPPASRLARRSAVEIIKEKSDYLRHPLMEELVDEKTYISEDAVQLMKFHGSYMQDHREKRAFGQGKFYQFMMRTRQPSGLVTNQLYLVMDDLADQVSSRSNCTRHLAAAVIQLQM